MFAIDPRGFRRRRGVQCACMSVDYSSFIEKVEQEANAPREDAERAARATLETLGERISAGEAEDIAQQLPEELRPVLIRGRDPQPFDVGEFVHRVAMREGVKEPVAKEHARAVFAALGWVVSPKEIDDMAAQLPDNFHDLVTAARLRAQRRRKGGDDAEERPSGVPSVDELYDRVAERAGIDRGDARRATQAALEALANRISGGEVDDLAAWLPNELQQPLARGKAKSKGAARPLTLEQFVQEIADLEGVDAERARLHARAVFSVLRETISREEFRDVFEQLPDEYAVLLGPRPA
jgi:uncharacterized protein (DUF2267 family)